MEASSVAPIGAALAGVSRLALDTAPIIYFVEAHARYDAVITRVFQRIAAGQLTGVTSVLTLAEVLAQSAHRRKVSLQSQYRDLLSDSQHFELVPIDVAVAERAVVLRKRYNLRMPDALQIAAALQADCHAFLTNDSRLKRVTELRVLVLDDLV
jgi:predicted nucleic acid-binding protein